ncbi:MAG: flagellar biosynthetic protein FliR [Candidatus Melainabacteria bacterium]|nr:flagellar biosynthetic protein FliR [Candidatus Melainabacteria bacterium]
MDLFTDLFRQNLFAQIGTTVVALGFVLVRVLAFMHFAPIFSHKSVPSHVRIGFAIFLTSMLAPKAFEAAIPDDGFSILYVLFANFALGFIIGFTTNILFTTVVAGGEMMDAAMGFSSGQMFDPSLGGQTTILGRFMGILTIVVFFQIGGPEALIQGLYNSFDTFTLFDPNMTINVAKIIHLVGDIIRMGFVLVSPVVLTILVNDLVLGLLSRASPQINAFQISFTIKPMVGVLILLMILPLFFTAVANFLSSGSRLY